MKKKIHNAILIAAAVIFACCILIVLGVSYPYFNAELKTELMREADYLCAGTEMGGKEYLERFQEERRITLISPDGSVIYDTVDDTHELENHIDREEVKEAFESGEGESIRYSSTLLEKTYYYARRLTNGSVLRVSANRITLGAVFLRMLLPLAAALLVVVSVTALLSSSLARKIVKPLNDLDLSSTTHSVNYPELSPLLRKISRQNALIDLQMEDLKKRKEEFLTLTNNMPEGFILIDSKGEILSYNKGAVKLLSSESSERSFSADCFAPFLDAIQKVLSGERCRPLIEREGKTLQIYANPVYVEDKVSGAVLFIMDVTEREQREAMRREFTSNVSHELKTPLTSIYGISDMMQNGIVRPEDVQGFARNIKEESGRLIELVNDIIKLSRLDEGITTPERIPTDLLSVCNEIRERLLLIAKEKNIEISVAGESALVNGIPTLIWEMIYNLCDNAIKYNKENGSVTMTVRSERDKTYVTVADTGIGIPKEHLDRVFERFYRVDKSHSRSIGGTGLGLSIVKHGAAVHNAKIKMESREGVGTSVTIIFS
ncbi:MAG: ATP-binding protein [Clostridia bacterium]|nr:ATP-binding protein [Clostridia bacterium]